MATIKAARSRPAPVRRTRVKAGADESDQLAKDLDRVLRVSDPVPQPTARRVIAGSSRPIAVVSRKVGTHAPPSKTSSGTNGEKQLGSAPKKAGLTSILPWMSDEMISAERAKGAMGAINISIKSLSAAAQSGYRHKPTTGPVLEKALKGKGKAKEEDIKEDEWTERRVNEVVDTCEVALKLLRVMDFKGELGGKGIEVERAALGIVAKCLTLGMYHRSLDQLILSRSSLLRRYQHVEHPAGRDPAPIKNESAQPKSKSRTPASSTKPAPSRLAPSKTSPSEPSSALKPNWIALSWVPSPKEGMAIDEVLRGLLCQVMLCSWVGLAGLAGPSDDLANTLPIPAAASTSPDRLHPFNLALSLPVSSTTPLLHSLYRILTSSSPKDRAQRRHTRHIGLIALSLTITTQSPPSKTTPGQFWEHCHQTLATLTDSATGHESSLPKLSETLLQLVNWVADMAQERSEPSDVWFRGKEWNALSEFWIGVARRVGDLTAVERALSFMSPSTSNSTPPPSSNGVASPPSAPMKRTTKGKERSTEESGSEMTKFIADVARTNLIIDKYIAEPSDIAAASAESALRSCSLFDLSDVLASCEDGNPAVATAAAKAVRSVERLRRACHKVLQRVEPRSSLALAVQQWLVSVVDLAEDVLQSPLDTSAFSSTLVAGATETLLDLCRLSDKSSLADLDRGHRLCDLARSSTEDLDQADWRRCLAATAYNIAGKYWKDGAAKYCLQFVRRSVDWTLECLEPLDDETRQKAPWKAVADQIGRRYVLLAVCSHKLSDRQGSCDAYFSSLAYTPSSTIDALVDDLKSKSLEEAFRTHTELHSGISRLAQIIAFDHSGVTGRTETCVRVLDRLPPAAKGAILERLVSGLLEGSVNNELAELSLGFSDMVSTIYTKEAMPLRRLRVLVSMMGVISQTGVGHERFSDLAQQVDEVSDGAVHGFDTNFAARKDEYVVRAKILRALQAYHTADSAISVYDLAKEAMATLRQIVAPPRPKIASPMKARTTAARVGALKTSPKKARGASKTLVRPGPVSRTAKAGSSRVIPTAEAKSKPRTSDAPLPHVFEDVAQLARLLGSLIALLGMSGHVLAKVEALKLHRALLRKHEDMVDDYVSSSSLLAIEYLKLGKHSRAKSVLSQTQRRIETATKEVRLHVRVELHLRQAIFLAMSGNTDAAEVEYLTAFELDQQIVPEKGASLLLRTLERRDVIMRATLARNALAAISMLEGDAATAIDHLSVTFKLTSRIADLLCRIAPQQSPNRTDPVKQTDSDPFSAPKRPTGADEPSKDSTTTSPSTSNHFAGKYLNGYQWSAAEEVINQILLLTRALAHRGTVKDAEYYLKLAGEIARIVRSPILSARIATRSAELFGRLRRYEDSVNKLLEAAEAVPSEGLEAVDIKRVKGDVYTKQEMIEEAGEIFDEASQEVRGLDAAFVAAEALMPSPKKGVRASVASTVMAVDGKETILPEALAHILRQQAWLLREAGYPEDCDQILAQIRQLAPSSETSAEELYLDGRIGLHEAFSHFKTDLWMSSLTESTIAMPMGNPEHRTRDRQSTRQTIQLVLQRSEKSFVSALSIASSTGRVEDVRQACLSLALLRAFQTSLGEGSAEITRLAAAILASSPAITLHREIIEVIETKFLDPEQDEVRWPVPAAHVSTTITPSRRAAPASPTPNGHARPRSKSEESDASSVDATHSYWQAVKDKYSATPLPLDHDLSLLPADWTVISINVTEDRNTMFVARYRSDSEPLIFTLPLDRQGRREGEAEEDLFTFDAALAQLQGVIDESNDGALNAKHVTLAEERKAWWQRRFDLDKRLQELVQTMEFCWLGAFKTILSPKCTLPATALQGFRKKLERIFTSAILNGGEGKKSNKVHLDDALLECFASLRADCKDEEAEDLVYFILDIYQFYGVPVALAELDIDQIAIDVKAALSELESARPNTPSTSEHLFLALDKNVSCFPWESIPILRGRAVSRVPSLPFLLDQIKMSSDLASPVTPDGRKLVDVKKVYYILNPSGDLARTQTFFEPWLERMKVVGWRGIVGRSPTELEMVDALSNYELVLYFGHGGAEQYIRSHKIKALPHCATVMLWGCSSGHLKDQGDLDRTGTAWNYMMAGCPSLVANLWDVTDRDIDRLSEEVFKQLNIDSAHIPTRNQATQSLLPISELSNVQAVAKAREECKLKYLTGAAPVVYGLPVYLH